MLGAVGRGHSPGAAAGNPAVTSSPAGHFLGLGEGKPQLPQGELVQLRTSLFQQN